MLFLQGAFFCRERRILAPKCCTKKSVIFFLSWQLVSAKRYFDDKGAISFNFVSNCYIDLHNGSSQRSHRYPLRSGCSTHATTNNRQLGKNHRIILDSGHCSYDVTWRIFVEKTRRRFGITQPLHFVIKLIERDR